MYTMTDYKSKVHNLFFTASYMATQKLRLFGSALYNKAEASFDKVVMPDVTDRLIDSQGNPALVNAYLTYENMETYSDLNYTLVDFAVGFEYRFLPNLAFTADGRYADLGDDGIWVF